MFNFTDKYSKESLEKLSIPKLMELNRNINRILTRKKKIKQRLTSKRSQRTSNTGLVSGLQKLTRRLRRTSVRSLAIV